jgi:hypothetical protein
MASVVSLLSVISKEVGAVKKDQKNTAQKFNFRGIDQVVNATHEAFTKHGVVPVPQVLHKDIREITSGGGKRQAWVLLTVEYTFYGPDGDSVAAIVQSEATDFADKATAKAMSVALRTALLQVLLLPTDDPDPDSEYVERGVPEHVQLQQQVVAVLKAKGIGPDAAKAEFESIGGSGKISECTNVTLLKDFLTMLEGA